MPSAFSAPALPFPAFPAGGGGGASAFAFESPAVLALLLLIPLYYVLKRAGFFRPPALPLTMGDWGGGPFIWKGGASRAARAASAFALALAAALAAASLAAPVMERERKIFTSPGTDILFILDASPSMAARDITRGGGEEEREGEGKRAITGAGAETGAESRFAAALSILRAASTLGLGNYGAAAFGTDAALICPLTPDTAAFAARLEGIAPGALGDASAIGSGIALGVYHLAASGGERKCAVLITDGESNAGFIHPLTAARLAPEHGAPLYVVGMGKRGAAPLDYAPKGGETRSGVFESRFDEDALRDIARAGGGAYFAAGSVRALEAALAEIAARETVPRPFTVTKETRSLSGAFLAAALAAAFAAWFIRRVILGDAL